MTTEVRNHDEVTENGALDVARRAWGRGGRNLILALLGIALVALLAAQLRTRQHAEPAIAPATAAVATPQVIAEGRLTTYPGADVVVGTDLAGTLVRVLVEERSTVRRGDLIAELRADDVRAEVGEAQARAIEAQAEVALAEVEVQRAIALLASNVGTQQAVDRATRDHDAALARHASARATVQRVEAVLDKTRILSPLDGVVIERMVQPGESVEAGARLLRIADLDRTRVEAEVDEYDAGRIALGAAVQVQAEGFAAEWRGRVEEIPDAVVGRKLKPQDPGRPTDTRVLLVKVVLEEATPLKLGQRVEVAITSPLPD